MTSADQIAIEAAADATIDRIDALADEVRFWVEEAFPCSPVIAREAASVLENFSESACATFDEEGTLAFGIMVAAAGPGMIAHGEAAVEEWKRVAAEADEDRREEAAVR